MAGYGYGYFQGGVPIGSKLNGFSVEISQESPAITPTYGNELLVNPNMELETSWIGSGAVATYDGEERTGGSGTRSLRVARPVDGTASNNKYQSITTDANRWYKYQSWTKNIDTENGVNALVLNLGGAYPINTGDWVAHKTTALKISTSILIVRLQYYATTDGKSGLFDDMSLKMINFSSMISHIGTSTTKTGTYYCNPVILPETQGGIIINYKDNSNFILAIVDRNAVTATAVNKIKLFKVVNGVYTEVLSSNIKYVNNAELSVFVKGNDYMLSYDGKKVGVVTISDEMGYGLYSFSTDSGNTIGTVVKIKQQIPTFPALTDVVVFESVYMPVGFINGVLYGGSATGGMLYKSTDYGANWSLVQNTGFNDLIRDIKLLPDGEVYILYNSALHKSTGWATNPQTATWTAKLSPNIGAWFLRWGNDVCDSKVIITEYAASPHDPAKKVWLSTDNAATFQEVFNLTEEYADVTNLHPHAACIDHLTGDLYISHGDYQHAIFHSSDDGTTWTKLPYTWAQPTTLKSAKYGIVAGSDFLLTGVYSVERITNIMRQMNFDSWAEWGWAMDSCRVGNNVFVVFRGNDEGLQQMPIYKSDGRYSNIVYSLPIEHGQYIGSIMSDGLYLICDIRNGKTLKITI